MVSTLDQGQLVIHDAAVAVVVDVGAVGAVVDVAAVVETLELLTLLLLWPMLVLTLHSTKCFAQFLRLSIRH